MKKELKTRGSSTVYMEKLMNEGNEWNHSISATITEGPADSIRIFELAAALKKMKKHKAPGLSGPVAEMIQTTGDIGTQNCETVASQRIGSQVWYYQFTKEKVIQWGVDRTEELNCWNTL